MYLDMVSDWRVQGASIRSVCECFVKFWHQEPCQYSTCPPSLWRTLAFLIDNGDRWEGTFIISVCESFIMIWHQEPCQDSTFCPSLFLESRGTWIFLMDLDMVSDGTENSLEVSVKVSSRSEIRNHVKTPLVLQVSSQSLGGHGHCWWTWRWCHMGGNIHQKCLWKFHQNLTSGTMSRLHLSSKSFPGV